MDTTNQKLITNQKSCLETCKIIRPLDVIVKTISECNLNCAYCYQGKNRVAQIMNYQTLETMLFKLVENNKSAKKTTLYWHGGEPLLAGIDFYKKAIEIENSLSPHKFTNRLQSNATLINSEWANFFKQYAFQVGVSIDGPAQVHNLNRIDGLGSGSFDAAFLGLIELQKLDLKPGAICVLNKNTINHMQEIYDFFKKNKTNFKVNPQYPSGNAELNNHLGITSYETGRAFIELFDIWFYDPMNPVIDVEPFTKIISNLGVFRNETLSLEKFGGPAGCVYRNGCSDSFICVDPRGDIYPCSRFSEMPEFKMGNINEQNLNEILSCDVRLALTKRKEQPPQSCLKCNYHKICNSGCANNAYLKRGEILDKDYFCESNLMLFSHIEKVIRKELNGGEKNE
jgi:uncharacterized protein